MLHGHEMPETEPNVIERAVAMYQMTLTGWASDYLVLQARGLDRPVSAGRERIAHEPAHEAAAVRACARENRASAIRAAVNPSDLAPQVKRGRRAA